MDNKLFVLSSILSFAASVIGFNISNIIFNYVLTCGFDRVCNISRFNLPHRPDFNYLQNSTKLCPICNCDAGCMARDDCCPDVFFSQPEVTCVNVTLLKFSSAKTKKEKEQDHYSLVSTCPNVTGNKLKEQCTGSDDIIQSLKNGGPVSGNEGMRLTYRNKYCAKCNDVHDFTNWMLDIDCDDFADFNYLSTYEEVVDLAKTRGCNILFKPNDKNTKPCSNDENIINVCNTTGKWMDYDADIEFACKSSYYNSYRYFKNIFCYLCNPSDVQKQETEAECNVTGLWEPNDPVLESACRNYKQTRSTFPFKNIFCYFCNRINSQMEKVEKEDSIFMFLDTKAKIKEMLYASSFKYSIDITQYNFEYFKTVVSKVNTNSSFSENKVVKENLKPYSITNLIRQFVSYEPSEQQCSPNKWLPNEVVGLIGPGYCSCKVNCAFLSYAKCCVDGALEQPYTCLPSNIYSMKRLNNSRGSFLVIDGCFRNADMPFSLMCQTTNMTNIFSLLPVVDYWTNEVSRNIFCGLCNSDVDHAQLSYPDLDKFMPFSIDIMCENNYLYFVHFMSFYDVFRQAQNMGCNIQIHEINNFHTLCSGGNELLIKNCNVTGFWPEIDADVLHACEEIAENILPVYYGYKNVFCYICNPQSLNGSVISSCNTTGLWDTYDSDIEFACMNMPRSYVTHPYKNWFCRLCNVDNIDDSKSYSYGGKYSPIFPRGGGVLVNDRNVRVSYRNIFALSSYQGYQNNQEYRKYELCDINQIQDKTTGICRNISCYPGKYLHTNTCSPLFPSTKNLRYTLSFMLTGYGNIAGIRNIDILKIIKNKIQNQLTQNVHVTSFASFYILSNFPCFKVTTNSTYMKILVNTNLFIGENVNRLVTETFLNDVTSTSLNLTIKGETVTFESIPNQEAFYLPSLISRTDYRHRCHLYEHRNFTFEPDKEYRTSYVSELLLCRQIQLNKNEFIINIEKTELLISKLGYHLKYNEFEITRNGNALVCLSEQLMHLLNKEQNKGLSEYEYILRIVTVVAIIVSLVCLLVTFFTYCLFPVLRSVPGQNNMCLVFAMFFAQLMFLISDNQKGNSTVCKTVGVISHFFWLCMFFSMNVCSFHMFHVFAGSLTTGSRKTGSNKLVFRYVLYSYGCPMIIIFLNILITFFVSELQNIGYGNNKCFISDLTSYIVTFLVPVILLCILNIYFFVVTGYKIRNTPRVQCNQSDRHNFIVYVKLFTITGISWIFQIIDSFLPLSAFSFIVTILNGFQGLFIFLSYICNKRVFNLYKNLYKNVLKTDSSLSTTSSSGTKATELSLTS